MRYLLFMIILLLLPVSYACPLSTDLTEGRYRDDVIDGFYVNCSGVTASSCLYSINDFANVTFNCSSPVINAELGWNQLSLCGSNGTHWNCTEMDLWAKKLSGGESADYAVMIVTLAVAILLFLLGGILRARIFWFVAGVGGLVLGYEMLAFSMIAGASVVICSGLFSLAVLFRRDG